MEEAVNVLQGLLLALSSFSKIPVPQIEWREENMRYMMCFFPVVGLAIGIVIGLWVWLSQAIGFGPTLFGAGLALLPIAVSGGIHMTRIRARSPLSRWPLTSWRMQRWPASSLPAGAS